MLTAEELALLGRILACDIPDGVIYADEGGTIR